MNGLLVVFGLQDELSTLGHDCTGRSPLSMQCIGSGQCIAQVRLVVDHALGRLDLTVLAFALFLRRSCHGAGVSVVMVNQTYNPYGIADELAVQGQRRGQCARMFCQPTT